MNIMKQYLEICEKNSISPDNGPECFTTADVAMDELLGGGIFTHGITEIFGESSTVNLNYLRSWR